MPQSHPLLSAAGLIPSEVLLSALSFKDGFHRAAWSSLRIWIESNLPATDQEAGWNEAALYWVSKLRDDLGGGYSVYQSRQTILLCEQSDEIARWLLEFAGRAADTIRKHLGPVAWSGALGKNVALIFSEQDDYDHYVSHHLTEGENPPSGGMCLHTGYTHIAVPWFDQFDTANVIVHELAHDCLAHLAFPMWLNEGVAVTLEKLIGPPRRPLGQGDQDAIFGAAIDWRPPVMWEELAERHFAFWNEQNIQTFWAGTSFYIPGDSNELSYSLAEVFVKLLSERGNIENFRGFLETSRQEDAGQSAAQHIFGADLGEIAGTFLGTGIWRPERKAIKECWEKAGWKNA